MSIQIDSKYNIRKRELYNLCNVNQLYVAIVGVKGRVKTDTVDNNMPTVCLVGIRNADNELLLKHTWVRDNMELFTNIENGSTVLFVGSMTRYAKSSKDGKSTHYSINVSKIITSTLPQSPFARKSDKYKISEVIK